MFQNTGDGGWWKNSSLPLTGGKTRASFDTVQSRIRPMGPQVLLDFCDTNSINQYGVSYINLLFPWVHFSVFSFQCLRFQHPRSSREHVLFDLIVDGGRGVCDLLSCEDVFLIDTLHHVMNPLGDIDFLQTSSSHDDDDDDDDDWWLMIDDDDWWWLMMICDWWWWWWWWWWWCLIWWYMMMMIYDDIMIFDDDDDNDIWWYMMI